MNVLEREFTRRAVFSIITGAILSGCNKPPEINTTVVKERENVPTQGDVLFDGKTHYLLRSGRVYPLSKGLDIYNRNSRAKEFGSRVFVVSSSTVNRFPLGNIPSLIQLDQIGDIKANRSLEGGGQKNIYFSGFMNDLGETFQEFRLNEVFGDIQEELATNKWSESDRLFYTYGSEGIHGYDIWATMRDPWENVKLASELINRFKEQFPLERFNLIGHSLGAFILFFAAEDHLDAINNLILLNGPILGLPSTLWSTVGSQILSQIYGDKAGKELLRLWGDSKHREHVKKILSQAKSIGNRIYTFGTENDLIVPPESSMLDGTEEELDGEKMERLLHKELTDGDYLWIHGKLLRAGSAPVQLEYYKKIIGENFISLT